MKNHFHLDVYLPEPPEEISEEEVLCRYAVLKGHCLEMEFSRWRLEGDAGERRVQEKLDGLRRQMYDIGLFMKRVKQWFTEDYNERQSHTGTMWEGRITAACEAVAKRIEIVCRILPRTDKIGLIAGSQFRIRFVFDSVSFRNVAEARRPRPDETPFEMAEIWLCSSAPRSETLRVRLGVR